MAADKMREIRLSIPEELFNLCLPRQTQQHLWKARKELLLAIRSLIDTRIEMIEKKEAGKNEPRRKIKVE
jgi:hypothetical protein